ncbi:MULTISPECIES: COG4315 family predicted lipoprotein [Streptomyces]|uniref:hypothetical protein n=1 Tax=Streptomyces TaxID=1883 RepID=UPI0008FC9A6A
MPHRSPPPSVSGPRARARADIPVHRVPAALRWGRTVPTGRPEGHRPGPEGTRGPGSWAEGPDYDGKPLSPFVKDTEPGDMSGDGVQGVWRVTKA